MSIEKDTKAWDDFLSEWPLERVQQMPLEEYTNPNRDDAFIYWLEKRLETLGSIWGGSAFKFGIYCRGDQQVKEAGRGRKWGEKYAWLTKYGETETEAFANIRNKLVEVIEAVQDGNLVRIDAVDLAPVLKWKIAFLYQDRSNPTVILIFKKEGLFYHYQTIDPTAKKSKTPYSVMYSTLLERHKDKGDLFDISEHLWTSYQTNRSRTVRAWAVPLDMADEQEVKGFCAKTQIEPEDIDPFLLNMLSAVDLGEGDLLALMTAGDVHAVGTLTGADGDEFSWAQVPLETFPSELLVVPQFEVKELTAAEQEEIWSHVPQPEEAEEKIEQLLGEAKIERGDKFIVIHPSASCPSKRWPQEHFSQLVRLLKEKTGFPVVVVTSGGEEEFGEKIISANDVIDLRGDLSISELGSLLKRAGLFISNDSGPVHIAAALEVPVISIFGRKEAGLSPLRWKPPGRNSFYFHKDVGCTKCLAHNCQKGFLCLKSITPEEVAHKAVAMIK